MDTKKTILYVDDEQLNLNLFEISFKKHYNVLLAENGEKGLELLDKSENVYAVLSDMKMPGMNGVQFINEARKKHKDKKYFIITGYDITPEISMALDSKLITKYFQKPYNALEVKTALEED